MRPGERHDANDDWSCSAAGAHFYTGAANQVEGGRLASGVRAIAANAANLGAESDLVVRQTRAPPPKPHKEWKCHLKASTSQAHTSWCAKRSQSTRRATVSVQTLSWTPAFQSSS